MKKKLLIFALIAGIYSSMSIAGGEAGALAAESKGFTSQAADFLSSAWENMKTGASNLSSKVKGWFGGKKPVTSEVAPASAPAVAPEVAPATAPATGTTTPTTSGLAEQLKASSQFQDKGMQTELGLSKADLDLLNKRAEAAKKARGK